MPCMTGDGYIACSRNSGSKCRSCGAPVKWVSTATGKKMPVNEGLIFVLPDTEGDTTIVSRDGMVVKGRLVMAGTDGAVQGNISHFATCPQAGEWRRSR